MDNPCTRCGKQRIDLKTWKEYVKGEYVGQSLITFTKTVCPDPECQKIVDAMLEEKREKKELMMQKKENEAAAKLRKSAS